MNENETGGEALRPFEEWAKETRSAPWEVAAAAQLRRWPKGQEVTQADYLRAVEAARGERIG
jgi:hypothetical protein